MFLEKNSDQEFRVTQFEIQTILAKIEADISGTTAWKSKVQRLPEKRNNRKFRCSEQNEFDATENNSDNSGVRQQGMRTSSDSQENANPKIQEFRRNGMQQFTDAHKTWKPERS